MGARLQGFGKKFKAGEYLFPKPCMIGSLICKIATSAIDVSDGFYCDLNKLTNIFDACQEFN